MQSERTIFLSAVLVTALTPAAHGSWVKFTDATDHALVLSAVFENDDTEKSTVVGDLNGDGRPDIVVARKLHGYGAGREDLLLLNDQGVLVDSTATFAPEFLSENHNAREVRLVDFDNDGWLDVFLR